ncbi:MAG: hypothetical protein Q8M03_12560 [Legionella sp.]|nr:hypothetical protein [Legionella sp.]
MGELVLVLLKELVEVGVFVFEAVGEDDRDLVEVALSVFVVVAVLVDVGVQVMEDVPEGVLVGVGVEVLVEVPEAVFVGVPVGVGDGGMHGAQSPFPIGKVSHHFGIGHGN